MQRCTKAEQTVSKNAFVLCDYAMLAPLQARCDLVVYDDRDVEYAKTVPVVAEYKNKNKPSTQQICNIQHPLSHIGQLQAFVHRRFPQLFVSLLLG
jgi:hypothetical protein